MSTLDEKDAVILADLAQSELLPRQDRESILAEASPKARRIGLILLGSTRGSEAERRVARELKRWARRNGTYFRQRKALRAATR